MRDYIHFKISDCVLFILFLSSLIVACRIFLCCNCSESGTFQSGKEKMLVLHLLNLSTVRNAQEPYSILKQAGAICIDSRMSPDRNDC